jgi:hypothetical protein
LLCTCATQQGTEYKKIDKYLRTHFKQYDPKANNCVFLLSEYGCIPCVKEFAELIKDYRNKPNTYIIICASGTFVDISPFIKDTALTNVYDDSQFVFRKDIYYFPSAIFLKDNKIDTIVDIAALKLDSIFTFIKQKADI